MSTLRCVYCDLPLNGDYIHRACAHHQCLVCWFPMMKTGKNYCLRCPPPERPTEDAAGAVVLGTDSEQNQRVAAELRLEREQVCPTESAPEGGAGAAALVGVCSVQADGCLGGEACLHDCYRHMSRESMRAEVQYAGLAKTPPEEWCRRVKRLIAARTPPAIMRSCGVTAPLLAYCGIRISDLVLPHFGEPAHTSHYYLEHLISGLALSYDDVLLLGFNYRMLSKKLHFPLIVLYDFCAMRAEQLFAFHLSAHELRKFVLHTDERYGTLLQLNLHYWFSALERCA